MGVDIRGTPVTYDVKSQTIRCGEHEALSEPVDGRIDLRILVDRGSIEVFGQRGRVAVSTGTRHPEDNRVYSLFAKEGAAKVVTLAVHELKSVWR